MQTIVLRSICPECKKEHIYQEVVSCAIPQDAYTASYYFEKYNTICECGCAFNQSENKKFSLTEEMRNFVPYQLSKKQRKIIVKYFEKWLDNSANL